MLAQPDDDPDHAGDTVCIERHTQQVFAFDRPWYHDSAPSSARPSPRLCGVMMTARPPAAKIPAWKFAGGIMLHISIPAYLMALAAVAVWHLLVHPSGNLAAAIARTTFLFLAADIALTAIVTGAAAAWGQITSAKAARHSTMRAGEPASLSATNLEAGLQAFGALADDPQIATAIAALRCVRWDHTNRLFQDVAGDLARAGFSMAGAIDKSTASLDPGVLPTAVSILGILLRRVQELQTATHSATLSQAEVMGGYIVSKYGPAVGHNDDPSALPFVR